MLKPLEICDFDKVYKIMDESFPSDERRSYDGQKKLFEEDEYRIFARYDGEDVTAFIALWDFEDFAYIEHFAVSEKCRNGGIGAKMLAEILKIFNKTVCLEVEPPENEIAQRRIKFYERNGFFLNNFEYLQPSLGDGKGEIPLLVMTSGKNADERGFEKIRNVLYEKVYKAKK
mgnify:FL=1